MRKGEIGELSKHKIVRDPNGRALLVVLLIISLALNVYLMITIVNFKSYIVRLEKELNNLAAQNENLSREVQNLRNVLDITRRQLEYYKNQTYYQGFISTGGLIGETDVNIVAVKIARGDLFTTYYEGVTLKAEVELRDGKGRILVNTEPRIGIDLQTSARIAVSVAEAYTGLNLTTVDVIITIKGEEEVEVVDGPSAGLPITVAIISALRHENISNEVYATGTINPDGSIGAVGGIAEKALAAAEKGARFFLVPKGQSKIVIYERREEEILPGFKIIRYVPKEVSLKDYLKNHGFDVEVFEVSNIVEAYSLYTIKRY
ncbi:MAG: S16 family serine protease [Candidatus Bathyarchaeia archaeon]